MSLLHYEKVSDWEVKRWLLESIPNLSESQKEKIEEKIVYYSPFVFYKRREPVTNIFIRLSIILFPVVWSVLVISLPFNFLITGKWGYDSLKWFQKWITNLGL